MKWRALGVLSAAQFLMVLDQAVMNVSIGQLVEDFDTSVTVIQGVITCYALTMAALMITGGKLGDRWGRKRALGIGLVVYGAGSAVTAAAPTVAVLVLGWSVLEGIGAALVLPALVATVAGSYRGADRAVAYGVIGGVAGAGIAVGPILGGWVTTAFTWRWVFVGEVAVALLILAGLRFVAEPPRAGRRSEVDWPGASLVALGLALFVYGILQASEWGWLADAASPVTPFGLSLAPFVIGAGLLLVALFTRWTERRVRRGRDPLVRLGLLRVPPVRAGLQMMLMQNLILMGVFFAIPLYLQVVQGLGALENGVRMLPVSVAMFVTSFVGARLGRSLSPRRLVRAGLWILLVAVLVLLGTIRPILGGPGFGIASALLGIGMGLIVSQLGNVVQSSVAEADRSEAGGLQFTAQQLGAAMGTALIGAVVITALGSAFATRIAADPRVPEEIVTRVDVELAGSIPFVPSAAVEEALAGTGLDPTEAGGILEAYESSQLTALRIGLLAAAALVVAALFLARHVPDTSFEDLAAAADPGGKGP